MAVTWISCFVTLSCILAGTVNSSTSNITITEFCSCWTVQSTAVRGNVCSVLLDFGNCWVDSNTTLAPGLDIISDTDLVKFGLTVANSISEEWNCTVDNVCRLTFEIGTLEVAKTYNATIQPQCDTCNTCSGKVTEFLKVTPTTTVAPSTTKRYRPPQHKYLFPTMLIGAIVCCIAAFIFVIRRWRQRIHHDYKATYLYEPDTDVVWSKPAPARKERAAAAASFANLQAESENNNGTGDNLSPPLQYGTSEPQHIGGAHYLNISEKHGIVNDAYD